MFNGVCLTVVQYQENTGKGSYKHKLMNRIITAPEDDLESGYDASHLQACWGMYGTPGVNMCK